MLPHANRCQVSAVPKQPCPGSEWRRHHVIVLSLRFCGKRRKGPETRCRGRRSKANATRPIPNEASDGTLTRWILTSGEFGPHSECQRPHSECQHSSRSRSMGGRDCPPNCHSSGIRPTILPLPSLTINGIPPSGLPLAVDDAESTF